MTADHHAAPTALNAGDTDAGDTDAGDADPRGPSSKTGYRPDSCRNTLQGGPDGRVGEFDAEYHRGRCFDCSTRAASSVVVRGL